MIAGFLLGHFNRILCICIRNADLSTIILQINNICAFFVANPIRDNMRTSGNFRGFRFFSNRIFSLWKSY